MTALVDFLPASARERRRRRRARRERLAVALILVAAAVATDLTFRYRIASVRRMAAAARQQADLATHRAFLAGVAERRIAGLRSELAVRTAPLRRPSVSRILDGLLVDLPRSVRFHELHCRVEPWSAGAEPWLSIDASCRDLAAFSEWLSAIRHSDVVPRVHFRRTDLRQQDGSQGFRLESAREGGR